MDTLLFSENLVRLRREKKITQEELADFIGVTKASVSKWENRQSLPDILLLPLLASFFDVTVDQLLGYEPRLSKEQIQKIYLELAADFAALPFEQVMDKSRHLVRKYYSCYPFLLQISVLYLNHYTLAENEAAQKQVLEEAAALCRHIETSCSILDIVNDAVGIKATLDLFLGKPKEVIQSLERVTSPYRYSYQNESVLIQAYQANGDLVKAHSYSQLTMYLHLVSLVGTAILYLGNHMTDDSLCEETIRRIDCLIDAFFMDSLHPNVTAQFHYQAALFYTMHNKTSEALNRLTRYQRTLLFMLSDEHMALHGDSYFNALDEWFERLELGSLVPRNKKLIRESCIQSFQHPLFASLAETDEFKKIVKGVTTYE